MGKETLILILCLIASSNGSAYLMEPNETVTVDNFNARFTDTVVKTIDAEQEHTSNLADYIITFIYSIFILFALVIILRIFYGRKQ